MNQLRQGDVMLTKIDNAPENLTPVKTDNGRVILAYGEVTGHAHAIDESCAKLFEASGVPSRFLHVSDDIPAIEAWKCQTMKGETVYVPAYETEERIRAAKYEPLCIESVVGAPMVHEEHIHEVILPGWYEATRQREEDLMGEVRQVAD